MTNDSETNLSDYSDEDAFHARLRAIAPAPTTASLERVWERLERANEVAPSPRKVELRLPTWAVFGSGAGIGALAASIAWIAITGWSALPSNGPGIASKPTGLPTPTASTGTSDLVSEKDLQSVLSTARDSTPRASYSIAHEEFGVDMIRNTLSALSKQQWDRRRLEERGFSISARSYRNAEPSAWPNRSNPSRSGNSLWDLRRGDMDVIGL